MNKVRKRRLLIGSAIAVLDRWYIRDEGEDEFYSPDNDELLKATNFDPNHIVEAADSMDEIIASIRQGSLDPESFMATDVAVDGSPVTVGEIAFIAMKYRLWVDEDSIKGLKEDGIDWEMKHKSSLMDSLGISHYELAEFTASLVDDLLLNGYEPVIR